MTRLPGRTSVRPRSWGASMPVRARSVVDWPPPAEAGLPGAAPMASMVVSTGRDPLAAAADVPTRRWLAPRPSGRLPWRPCPPRIPPLPHSCGDRGGGGALDVAGSSSIPLAAVVGLAVLAWSVSLRRRTLGGHNVIVLSHLACRQGGRRRIVAITDRWESATEIGVYGRLIGCRIAVSRVLVSPGAANARDGGAM